MIAPIIARLSHVSAQVHLICFCHLSAVEVQYNFRSGCANRHFRSLRNVSRSSSRVPSNCELKSHSTVLSEFPSRRVIRMAVAIRAHCSSVNVSLIQLQFLSDTAHYRVLSPFGRMDRLNSSRETAPIGGTLFSCRGVTCFLIAANS